jgi:PST family polysaccharide transporter
MSHGTSHALDTDELGQEEGTLVPKPSARNFSRDLTSLYAVHVATYFIPLVTIPYLSRTLGPGGWGVVAFFQSYALSVALIIEYGFGFSASRDLAENRDDPRARMAAIAHVTSAKLLISAAVVLLISVPSMILPTLASRRHLLAIATVWAISQGFNMAWYYLGIGRIRDQAIVDILCRGVGTLLIFCTVQSPSHTDRVLLCNAGAAILSAVICAVRAKEREPLPRLTIRGGIGALKAGWSIFLYRAAVSLYTLANGFLLGFFAPPAIVGYYAGAERIARACTGLLQPLSQSIFSRLAYVLPRSASDGFRLARRALAIMALAGAALGVILAAGAPKIVRCFLGPGFGPAVNSLRIFALLPPIAAVGTSLGIHWMIPLRMDGSFTCITLLAGVANLTLATVLAPRLGHIGMCISVVVSESLAAALYMWKLHHSGVPVFGSSNRD